MHWISLRNIFGKGKLSCLMHMPSFGEVLTHQFARSFSLKDRSSKQSNVHESCFVATLAFRGYVNETKGFVLLTRVRV